MHRKGTTIHRLQAKQCAPASFSSPPPPSSASASVLPPPLPLRKPLNGSSHQTMLSIASKASPSSADQPPPDQQSEHPVTSLLVPAQLLLPQVQAAVVGTMPPTSAVISGVEIVGFIVCSFQCRVQRPFRFHRQLLVSAMIPNFWHICI